MKNIRVKDLLFILGLLIISPLAHSQKKLMGDYLLVNDYEKGQIQARFLAQNYSTFAKGESFQLKEDSTFQYLVWGDSSSYVFFEGKWHVEKKHIVLDQAKEIKRNNHPYVLHNRRFLIDWRGYVTSIEEVEDKNRNRAYSKHGWAKGGSFSSLIKVIVR